MSFQTYTGDCKPEEKTKILNDFLRKNEISAENVSKGGSRKSSILLINKAITNILITNEANK